MTTNTTVAILLNSEGEILFQETQSAKNNCDSLGSEFPPTGQQIGPHMIPTG